MLRIPIHRFFAFGSDNRLLRWDEALAMKKVRGDENTLQSLLANFLAELDALGLRVTENAASAVRSTLESLQQYDEDAVVGEALADKVATEVQALDTTLSSELQLQEAFVVAPKRFDTKKLLCSPFELLGRKGHEGMPGLCQFDFASGCQCIALDVPTAAAFHLMRCMEGLLRHYYCAVVKRKRVKPLLWGPMVHQLRGRSNGPPKVLLDHLDNIRHNFRNPTQHPDARYDNEGVQDLLAVVIDAVNKIRRDLKARTTD